MAFRRPIILVLLLIFNWVPAQARESIEGKTWVLSVPSQDPAYVADLRALLENAEGAYVSFFNDLGLKRHQNRRLKIRIFKTLPEFKAFQKENSKSRSDHAFYSLFNSEIYTWEKPDPGRIFSNILHEATHHYIREFFPRETIPRCLDEGLAEVFEMSYQPVGNIRPGSLPDTLVQKIRQKRQLGPLKPITYFIEMPPKVFVRYADAKMHIAQCWAFCHFLLFEDAGAFKPLLKPLFNLGETRDKPDDTLTSHLPSGVSRRDFDEKWQAFLGRL